MWLAPHNTSDQVPHRWRLFNNFAMPRKPFIQMLKYPIATKHDRNILSLAMIGKLSYGGLFISIKVFNPESPHFFKGSQMLRQQSSK